MQLVNATSTELSSVCRTHAHFLLFLCNLLRDGKQVQRCIEACANTNNRNSFYTGGRSELFFGCFCLQLCSLSGWPHSVCVLGEDHPWRTDFLSVFLCAFTALAVWPVAGVYQMFVGLTLCPLSSTRWGHAVLRSAMFSALFESTCWCKNSILCQTVVPFMVSTSLSSHLWSYNIKIWNVHRDV